MRFVSLDGKCNGSILVQNHHRVLYIFLNVKEAKCTMTKPHKDKLDFALISV